MKTSLYTAFCPSQKILNKINERHNLNAAHVKISDKLSESAKAVLEANRNSIGRCAEKHSYYLKFKPAHDLFGDTKMIVKKRVVTYPFGINLYLKDGGSIIEKVPVAKHVLDSSQDSFVNDIKKIIKALSKKEKEAYSNEDVDSIYENYFPL